MVKRYSFCHGWMVSPKDHNEVTCRRRESCQYYDVDFYRKHVHHLDEFEEMFPYEPCPFFLPYSNANGATANDTVNEQIDFLKQ